MGVFNIADPTAQVLFNLSGKDLYWEARYHSQEFVFNC